MYYLANLGNKVLINQILPNTLWSNGEDIRPTTHRTIRT